MDPHSLGVELEVLENIEENEQEASENIEKNERETSENIEENEQEASENIEKNERETSENIEENEQEASENIEENERGFVELTNLNNAAREIVACIVAASFHVSMVTYTMALDPDLVKKYPNVSDVTLEQTFLIAFLHLVCLLIGCLLGGFLTDKVGRLRTLQISAIPCLISFLITLTLSPMIEEQMVLIGQLLSKMAIALATSPAIVYITEMARPKLRGSMISFGLTLEFFGKLLYLKGDLIYITWRLNAIVLSTIYMVVLIIAMQFLMPESPVWLVSKGRIDDARKSLEWLYKNETSQGKTSMAELQFNIIMKENEIKLSEQQRSKHGSTSKKLLDEFLKPTGWKPMVILFLLFSFQQFSGNDFYVMFCLFKVSPSFDYNLMMHCLIVTYFLCSMVSIWLLWRYKRRPLCIISCLGMTVCIISEYFTLKTKNGNNCSCWVPVICLFLYVCMSMVGMSTVPWTMTAELFPIEIRGIANSISYLMTNFLSFIAFRSYIRLEVFLGGTYAVQWCYAGVSMGAAVFVLLMLPETHGKKLSEIEEYFDNNFLALEAEAKDKKRQAERRLQHIVKLTESLNPKPESV